MKDAGLAAILNMGIAYAHFSC